MPPIPVVLIGAGQRGAGAYASYALRRPEEMRIVAVAEPDDRKRAQLAKDHEIPAKRCFRSWEDLLDAPVMGEAALVCTADDQHVAPSIGALEVGYHVVVETPMAQTPSQCLKLLETAKSNRQMLLLTHVLRYTAFYRALFNIVRSGRLGQIVQYNHHYSMAFWHMAHRFVRGSERHNSVSPMILSAGSHEFDLLLWLLDDSIESVSSSGSLQHFRIEKAPIGNVPERCVDECPIEEECPFSAIGTYIDKRFRDQPSSGWPYSALAHGDESPEALDNAIRKGEWGKCVYHYDNDVVDHQAVILETKSGVSAALTISGHNMTERRMIKIDGSHGSLVADFNGLDSHITVAVHATKQESTMNFRLGSTGHGGDHGLMGALRKVVHGEAPPLTLAQDTWLSHMLAFAVEEARTSRKVVTFPHYLASQKSG